MATPVMSMADLGEGQTACVRVRGIEILLSQYHGQFYAVRAQCSHAGQSLARGTVTGMQVSCPLHGAKFDLRTGQCLAAPAQAPLQRFPVFVEAGKVCVEV